MKQCVLFLLSLALLASFAGCNRAPGAAAPSSSAPAQPSSTPAAGSPAAGGAASSQPASAPAAAPALTAEEQLLVGLWEAEDGSLVAVRPRGNRTSQDFPFDAIHLEPVSGQWLKITRDETTFDTGGGVYVLSDLYLCPDPSDPESGRLLETEERLEYDPASDTLLHTSRHPTPSGEVKGWINTLTRTEHDPADPAWVDWAWYYEIHPDRM